MAALEHSWTSDVQSRVKGAFGADVPATVWRAARLALALCVVWFPHGDTPHHCLSHTITNTHEYPFHDTYVGNHYLYSCCVIALTTVSLFCATGELAGGVVALALLQLPVAGAYLAHSTNHGNTTATGLGVWFVIAFAQSSLVPVWPTRLSRL
jgi:hypothetical protein